MSGYPCSSSGREEDGLQIITTFEEYEEFVDNFWVTALKKIGRLGSDFRRRDINRVFDVLVQMRELAGENQERRSIVESHIGALGIFQSQCSFAENSPRYDPAETEEERRIRKKLASFDSWGENSHRITLSREELHSEVFNLPSHKKEGVPDAERGWLREILLVNGK